MSLTEKIEFPFFDFLIFWYSCAFHLFVFSSDQNSMRHAAIWLWDDWAFGCFQQRKNSLCPDEGQSTLDTHWHLPKLSGWIANDNSGWMIIIPLQCGDLFFRMEWAPEPCITRNLSLQDLSDLVQAQVKMLQEQVEWNAQQEKTIKELRAENKVHTLPLPEFKPIFCIYSTISEFALRSFYIGVWVFCISCIELIRIPQG